MKKCLAFAVVLGLGLVVAGGCNRPAAPPAHHNPPPANGVQKTEKAKPAQPAAKPAEKPGEKK